MKKLSTWGAEIREAYGEFPVEVEYLLQVMFIRRQLKLLGVSAFSLGWVDSGRVRFSLSFVAESPIERLTLARMMQENAERFEMLSDGRLAVTLALPHKDEKTSLQWVRMELLDLTKKLLRVEDVTL